MLREALLVGIGGFAGSISRYLISGAMTALRTPFPLPLGTFTVNAIGSLLIGLLLALLDRNDWYYLCIIGFCGGFTTFSTFSSEVVQLFRSAHYLPCLLYIVASVVICAVMVWVGFLIGEKSIS